MNRQRTQGGRHSLAQNSSVRRAARGSLEPGDLGTASTPLRPLDAWAYVLGLAICVAPHGLQQTAEHSFYSKCSGREKSLQCGTMRSSKDGDNLEVLPDVANLEVSFGPRGTDVQIRRLAWLLCIASRLSNSVLSSIMRPYTPHAGRRWHIHPAARSGMERAEPRANAFDSDSTGTDIRVRRARYESELQR